MIIRELDDMKNSFWNILKENSKTAEARILAKQTIVTIKLAILEFFRAKKLSTKYIDKLSLFLDSEIGVAVLYTIAGIMLTYSPKFRYNQFVTQECRSNGITSLIINVIKQKFVIFKESL